MYFLTMAQFIPSGSGHFLISSLLITLSTSCSVKSGSIWESGGSDASNCDLMFLCCLLSCAGESSRKNL